jgi:cysteine desulfurase
VLPNTLCVLFPDTTGAEVLAGAAGELAASTGSACHAGEIEPSAVLLAMGLDPQRARGSVRLTVGRSTTPGDVDRAASVLTAAWRSART